MNLREQIEKEITDKVMTKLASEKVELAGVKDIEKAISEYKEAKTFIVVAESFYDESKIAYNKFEQAWTEYYSRKLHAENSIKKGKAFDKDIQELQKTAKDLGIDVKQIKGYSELLKLKSDVEKEFSRINKLKYPAK